MHKGAWEKFKFQLTEYSGGSCRGMRTRVIVERKEPAAQQTSAIVANCQLQLWFLWYVEIKCHLDATDDFHCRSYCLLNKFRAPLCLSSGAESIIQEFAACGIWCFGFQVVGMVWSWGLCVRLCPQLHTIPTTWKPKHQIPQAATTCIILSSSWW